MKAQELNNLKNEIGIKAKYGLDFIVAACIVWLGITYIWTLDLTSYNKSILTFIVSGPLLPIAYIFSKIFNTTWKIKDNPLQPLGLWLNFAQLFYFPFLILILIVAPDYFVISLAIITGAHLFPYAWFYNQEVYAIIAGIIPIGSLLIGIKVEPEMMCFVPLFTAVCFLILAITLYMGCKTCMARNTINQ